MSRQNICHRCFEWHLKAVEVFHGNAFPEFCQGCGRSTDELKNQLTPYEIGVRMFVVNRDGIYQVMCQTCKEAYCMKRADLYKGTQFAEEQKIA